MLRSCKEMLGYSIAATDGNIGSVKDVYFDDASWQIHYFVVSTARWLLGRRVLLSPFSFDLPNWRDQSIPSRLSRDQVKASPAWDEAAPISREYEIELTSHYSWPAYWGGSPELHAVPAIQPAKRRSEVHDREVNQPSNLRSLAEVTGYHIHAKDGEIGKVEDLIADSDHWRIRLIAVDISGWLPGPSVGISPQRVTKIRWTERSVFVDLTKEAVEHSPDFDPAAAADSQLEVRWYDYSGRPLDTAR